MRMTSSAASRWKFAAVLLCSILCHVAAQQDNSFLGELERQQRIQLEQQEIQGQLQDLALRHQAAKDSRNEERVILLEGAREKLLNKLQELQEELQRMLHGPRLPIRSQNVRRPAAPKTTTTTSTTPQTTTPTVRNQVDFQPQEEVFQIPEFPIQVAAPPPSCNTVDGVPGDCRPLVQCLTFYLEINTLSRSRCPLGVGSDGSQRLGVCCPLRGPLEVQFEQPLDRRNQGVLLPPPPPRVVIPQFTQQQLSSAANDALRKLQERVQATAFIFSQGVFVPPVQTAPSPVGTHQERFFALTPGGNTVKKAEDGQKNVEASISLVEQFNLTPDQGTFALPTFSLLSTIIGDACPRRPQCPGLDSELRFTKYRSADGTCNNLRNGEWGSANIALQRILPPKYGDGVNAPRVADGFSVSEANRDGGSDGLPGARVVSTQFAAASSPNAHSSHEHTLILMQWGQFLDHDLTHTPISRGNSGGISCCRNGMAIPFSSNLRHPDCYPIPIPGDDGFFKQFREKCMEFVRSLPAPRPQCNFGPREQMNQVTGYIDASNVYGSSSSSQRNLRALSGGRLKVQPSNPSQEVKQQSRRDKGLLPGSRDQCTDEFDEKECFDAGDVRANEQPELALMHTLWVREHNRIADALSEMHTNWSDEQLFQESRRIVAAEMQHITYNEFLPIILGKEYMDKFQLTPLVTSGGNHTHLYDADLNAGITNVFATAAFRFGHSLIQGNIQSFTKFGTVKQSLQLSKNQFSPFTLYEEGAVDDFVRGLSTQTCQRFDRFFTPELTNHLFQGDLPFGLDLVALNIQRGRDHGIAPYAEWREVCGYKKPTRWEDLLEVMERETVEVLRGVYNTVSEIDLFIGGVGERGGLGGSSSLLGPTFACLVGDQFARLRRGDRFYYEEGDQPSSFNDRQLEQLRKASLARILCDNSDDVAVMQPLAFYKATFLNQRVPCESSAIPRVDLRAWAQEIPAAA
ncbi:peroxidase-like isoform X2 [Ischnura elegans]|uniref:peroxidase-like isoform X2 n=1 Tax=Ischnura elegans TaxID=197161 RepID=UPI001ED8993A|nr:peroxidase-like isoform X2 [Ischnura elegans]